MVLMVLRGYAITAKKILFIGDSITKHAPNAGLEWTGNWGMAATDSTKDFAHLLFAKIAAAQTTTPAMAVDGVGGASILSKVTALNALKAIGADVVFIQIGENDPTLTQSNFAAAYDTLVGTLRKSNPEMHIFCASVWKDGSKRDEVIKPICVKYGAAYADISAEAAKPVNSALATGLFPNAGVNWHPSNAGMQAYADAFWSVYAPPVAIWPIHGAVANHDKSHLVAEDANIDAVGRRLQTGRATGTKPLFPIAGKARAH